jgi:hypothetical protein
LDGDYAGVGGVVGCYWAGSGELTACYNTGSVTMLANDNVTIDFFGAVLGYKDGISPSLQNYWLDVVDAATNGIGNPNSNTYNDKFSAANWPNTGAHAQWGTGDGSGDNLYWKSLGSWNDGSPIYPKLWFE